MSYLAAGSAFWYIISILCFIALILSTIPLFHTLYHLWIKKTQPNISKFNKILVLLSLTFLFVHVCDHSFFRLCQLVPGGFGIHLEFCVAHIWIVSTAYYMGKAFMYCYFVLRAHETLKHTSFAYKTYTVYTAIFIIIIFSFILTIVWPILDMRLYSITTINATKGRECQISSGDYKFKESIYTEIISYELVFATICDIIFSIIAVFMLVGKLFNLSNIALTLKRKTEFITEEMSEYSITKKINEKQLINYTQRYHSITKHENSVLILSSKLLVLLLIAVLSAQVTLVLFLWISGDIYLMDSCLNMYCIWLTFRFSDKYYETIFCGSCCISSYFPCLKTISIGCDEEERNNQGITCNEIINVCCCCCVDSSYGYYYRLSKKEYEIYLKPQMRGKKKDTVGIEMPGNSNELQESLL